MGILIKMLRQKICLFKIKIASRIIKTIQQNINGILKFLDKCEIKTPDEESDRLIFISKLIRDFFWRKREWIHNKDGKPMRISDYDNTFLANSPKSIPPNIWIVQKNFKSFRKYILYDYQIKFKDIYLIKS